MTNQEKLKALYTEKAKQGLVDVRFVLNDSDKNTSVEELCGDVLRLQEAIDAGRFRSLDFGDLRWKKAN